MPCKACIEDDWPNLDPNKDEIGEIKSKTVDLRGKNVKIQPIEEFEAELAKADWPEFIE